jgi:hypothetical protein
VVAKTRHVDGVKLRGLKYVAFFYSLQLTPLFLPLTLPLATRVSTWPRIAWLLLLCVAFPAWSALVGGDYMSFFRFIIPSTPFMAILGALGLAGIPFVRQRTLAFALTITLGLLPLFNRHVLPKKWLATFNIYTPKEQPKIIRQGKFRGIKPSRKLFHEATAMNAMTEPGETLVTAAIGYNGYFTHVNVYDLCGLVDRRIARASVSAAKAQKVRPGHEKCRSSKAFLDRDPDILQFDVLIDPKNPAKLLRQRVAKWDDPKLKKYAPTMKRLEIDGSVLYGLALRRGDSRQHAQSLRQAFEAEIERMEAAAETPAKPRDRITPGAREIR